MYIRNWIPFPWVLVYITLCRMLKKVNEVNISLAYQMKSVSCQLVFYCIVIVTKLEIHSNNLVRLSTHPTRMRSIYFQMRVCKTYN